MTADHARPAELVLCGGDARRSDRRGRRSRGRPGVAGAVDLSQADADAAREVQIHRRGGRILRSPHRFRRDPRRARLSDRARARQHRRAAAALPEDLRNRRPDAAVVHDRAVSGLRRQGHSDQRDRERRAQGAARRARNCCRPDRVPKVTSFIATARPIRARSRRTPTSSCRAGIKQFPYPNLRYGCGMGKCGKCACRFSRAAEQLPEPNWKEKKRLGARVDEGYRLICQLWLSHDIELEQDKIPVESPAPAALCNAHRGERSERAPTTTGIAMYVILTSKPGQFRTETVDGLRPLEAYDYRVLRVRTKRIS